MPRQQAWLVGRIRLREVLQWGWILGICCGTWVALWAATSSSDPPPRPKRAVFSVRDKGMATDGTPRTASPWMLARTRLEVAHRLRREGRLIESIRAYSAVADTAGARTTVRQAARAWRARLRLERGEVSALDELLVLSSERLPPQLYGHIATSVARAMPLSSQAGGRAVTRAVMDAVTRGLTRSSSVRGASGERAQRWLTRVRATRAQFFSP